MDAGAETIGVVGAGVVGKVLAAFLARAGHRVRLVDVMPEEVRTINERGIRVGGVRRLTARVEKTVFSLAELMELDPSVIFVCVKCTAQKAVAEGLEAWDTGRPIFVCFQNGLDSESLLCETFTPSRVLRGVVNYAGATVAPGTVKMTFFNPPNYLGPMHPALAETASHLANLLTQAGLDTEAVDDVRNKAWRKTILNAALVPIAVLTRLPMNRIMGLPDTRELVVRLIDEFLEVAKADGQVFEHSFKDDALRYLDNAGEHRASMLMDFEAGHSLEIEFMNGRLQRLARQNGLSCLTNSTMLRLIRGLLLHRDQRGPCD